MRTSVRLAGLLVGALLIPLAWAPVAAQNDDVFDDLIREMEEIRELDLIEELDIQVMSREEYVEQVESDEPDENQDFEYADYDRVLTAFGFIQPGDSTRELHTDLYGSNVLGYYDPFSNEMVVIVDDPGEPFNAISRVTFAHEVVHALQDQNLPMESLVERRTEATDDEYFAITSLVEGDASLAEIDLLLGDVRLAREYLQDLEGMTNAQEPTGGEFPAYVVETLYFPYQYGLTFVQHLYDEGGWDLVNDSYDEPPTTTEQILHPEKYMDGEEAIPIEVPDLATALGGDWRTIEHNTHGEFVISLFLAESDLAEGQVQIAHEGWGGDEYTALTNEEDTAVAWVTEWDSEQDATEFFRAAVVRESGRLDSDVERVRDGVIVLEGEEAAVMISQAGSRVTYLQGPDLDTLDILTDEVGD